MWFESKAHGSLFACCGEPTLKSFIEPYYGHAYTSRTLVRFDFGGGKKSRGDTLARVIIQPQNGYQTERRPVRVTSTVAAR